MASPRILIGMAWATTVIGALWVGRLMGTAPGTAPESAPGNVAHTRSSHAARSHGGQGVAVPVLVPAAGGDLSAEQIRRVVREELARQPAPGIEAGGIADGVVVEQAPEDSDRSEQASELIERAVAAGRWSASDRAEFAALTTDLPPPTIIELERQLNIAINRGQVEIGDGLPPFGHLMP